MATTDLDIKGALVKSGTKYRKEVLTMVRMAIERILKHMTVRSGIQGTEIVGTLGSGAQIRPYRTEKGAKNTTTLRSRELQTYLGDVLEEFDPYAIYETCFGQSHTVKRTELDIVKAIVVEMAKVCSEYLGYAIFTAVRKADGDTTADLFNGFDTTIKIERAEKYDVNDSHFKISKGNGNFQELGELNVANIGDKLLQFYRACHTIFKDKLKVKMYVPYSHVEMYDEWYNANFNYKTDPDKVGRTLHGTDKKVEIVPLACMQGVEHIILSTKKNMLIGTDQMSAKERFEINKCDNPKVVQYFMTMYFGANFESIDEREFCCASFSLEGDVIPPTVEIKGAENVNLSAALNASVKDSIIVKGRNLTGPLTVTIEGAGFTADMAAITVAQAHMANGKKVTITYAPTDALHTGATLSIVSEADGINETIELIGTITA